MSTRRRGTATPRMPMSPDRSVAAASFSPRTELVVRHAWPALAAGAMLTLAPGAVSALKLASAKQCPYDPMEYGGYVAYRSIFEPPLRGVQPGCCFPDGHSSAGHALLTLYFAGPALGRPARAGLGIGLAAGLAFGATRIEDGSQ